MIPRDETTGVCKWLSVSTKELCWLVTLMHMAWLAWDHKTVKRRESHLVILYENTSTYKLFLTISCIIKRFGICYLIYCNKTVFLYVRVTFSFHANLDPAKGLHAGCVTQQLTTSEGLALKPCNVSNCFPAIIPPSSLTQLPVTSPDKGHTMEGYFLCRHIRLRIRMHSHHMHTCRRTRLHTLWNDTIVLMVARRCCNLWRYRVAGLAPHQCLRTRWWAFADRALARLL